MYPLKKIVSTVVTVTFLLTSSLPASAYPTTHYKNLAPQTFINGATETETARENAVPSIIRGVLYGMFVGIQHEKDPFKGGRTIEISHPNGYVLTFTGTPENIVCEVEGTRYTFARPTAASLAGADLDDSITNTFASAQRETIQVAQGESQETGAVRTGRTTDDIFLDEIGTELRTELEQALELINDVRYASVGLPDWAQARDSLNRALEDPSQYTLRQAITYLRGIEQAVEAHLRWAQQNTPARVPSNYHRAIAVMYRVAAALNSAPTGIIFARGPVSRQNRPTGESQEGVLLAAIDNATSMMEAHALSSGTLDEATQRDLDTMLAQINAVKEPLRRQVRAGSIGTFEQLKAAVEAQLATRTRALAERRNEQQADAVAGSRFGSEVDIETVLEQQVEMLQEMLALIDSATAPGAGQVAQGDSAGESQERTVEDQELADALVEGMRTLGDRLDLVDMNALASLLQAASSEIIRGLALGQAWDLRGDGTPLTFEVFLQECFDRAQRGAPAGNFDAMRERRFNATVDALHTAAITSGMFREGPNSTTYAAALVLSEAAARYTALRTSTTGPIEVLLGRYAQTLRAFADQARAEASWAEIASTMYQPTTPEGRDILGGESQEQAGGPVTGSEEALRAGMTELATMVLQMWSNTLVNEKPVDLEESLRAEVADAVGLTLRVFHNDDESIIALRMFPEGFLNSLSENPAGYAQVILDHYRTYPGGVPAIALTLQEARDNPVPGHGPGLPIGDVLDGLTTDVLDAAVAQAQSPEMLTRSRREFPTWFWLEDTDQSPALAAGETNELSGSEADDIQIEFETETIIVDGRQINVDNAIREVGNALVGRGQTTPDFALAQRIADALTADAVRQYGLAFQAYGLILKMSYMTQDGSAENMAKRAANLRHHQGMALIGMLTRVLEGMVVDGRNLTSDEADRFARELAPQMMMRWSIGNAAGGHAVDCMMTAVRALGLNGAREQVIRMAQDLFEGRSSTGEIEVVFAGSDDDDYIDIDFPDEETGTSGPVDLRSEGDYDSRGQGESLESAVPEDRAARVDAMVAQTKQGFAATEQGRRTDEVRHIVITDSMLLPDPAIQRGSAEWMDAVQMNYGDVLRQITEMQWGAGRGYEVHRVATAAEGAALAQTRGWTMQNAIMLAAEDEAPVGDFRLLAVQRPRSGELVNVPALITLAAALVNIRSQDEVTPQVRAYIENMYALLTKGQRIEFNEDMVEALIGNPQLFVQQFVIRLPAAERFDLEILEKSMEVLRSA